ncbi:hypothetical protein [Ruegeria sp. MALMAid1280]|uniref:hypothetical protein n=1 Tax=Ruegeria sp. MALMAid1280 TaxID=3411634 RepID=UPI003B9F3DF7
MGDPHGKAILRAFITTDITKGQVIAPIHWTGETAPSARINAVAVMRGFLTTLPQVSNLGLLSGRAPADMPTRVQFCVPALMSA